MGKKLKKQLFTIGLLCVLVTFAAMLISKNSFAATCSHHVSTRTVSPTCTSQGYTEAYCTKCGKSISKSNYRSALGHNYKANSCTTDKCTRCSSTRSGGYGHSPVDGATLQNASCTNPGVIARKCSRCGAGCGSRTTSALGHNYQANSCTTDKCTRCSSTRSGGYGHSPKDGATMQNATCTNPGVISRVCSRCGAGCGSRSTPALGHNYQANSCTTDKCTRCSSTRSGGYGHSPRDNQTLKNPTCTEVGVMSLICSKCGAGCGSRNIPATGHSYAAYNCTTDKCKWCSSTRAGGLGHNPRDDKTMKNPTCTETGVMSRVCDRCGAGCGSRSIPALGHNLAHTSKEATCEEDGYNRHGCSRCSYEESKEIIPAKGHDTKYIYTDPECNAPGYKEGICKVCDKVVSSTPYKDPLGHDWKVTEVTATCTQGGTKVEDCKRCGERKVTSTPKLGHDLLAPTCTENLRCSRCDFEEPGTRAGHSFTKAVSCGEVYRCARCDIKDPSGKKVPHDYSGATPCTYCGKTECDYTGHIYNSFNLCTRCNKTKCEVEGHIDGYTSGDHWHVTSFELDDPTEMGSKHEFQCSRCGAWENWIEHTWSRHENIAPGSHMKICKCGASRPEKCEADGNSNVCKHCRAEITHTCRGTLTYQELDRFATQIYGHIGKCEDSKCTGFVEEHEFVPVLSDTQPNAEYYVWLPYADGGGQYFYMICSKCGSTDIVPPEELLEMMALDDAEKQRMQEDLGFLMSVFLKQVGNSNSVPLTEYEKEVLQFTAQDTPERQSIIQKALKWFSKTFLGEDDTPEPTVPESIVPEGRGFATFADFKKEMGPAGEGRDWHHIVEQSQIERSGFAPEQIHNTNNLISIDHDTHMKITGYYNTKSYDFTNGLSVRDWLTGQSFEAQYEFGINVLKQYGVIP